MTPILDPVPASTFETERSIRPHIIRGYSWMLGMRWGVRILGLVSTVILARLLVPADFGLVAMAMLFVGLLEVFCETGQQLALIRHPNPTREHYNSAWTISILISLGLTVLLVTIAPLSTLYFPDERIVPIIQVLSLRVFFRGFENIGVTNFRRDLDFMREFRFGMIKKILSFGFTISLAVVWHNYWVLVLGIVFAHTGCIEPLRLENLLHHAFHFPHVFRQARALVALR